ncbi:MAG: acetyl-CoA hydrolase/transferase C-terminal domain-containing protein [Phenylobacterium sp.]|uniref:acetyl-CoA hydrolase/transferase family protein n=1 Tax=Phenylobacterium sp. TaxID=1871053 RepID=UPI002A35DF05|nr:acetyl-CoA hydrolase/transferase C-terminal domain-containing protein [Phenylobacterium sp.]MDX9999537.1 acetyl-CoA hydrolase/transferase C-terminal domain-containing protein [Phenylobacterium sp.]
MGTGQGRRLAPEEVDFRTIVRPGDMVVWTPGAGEPVSLIERLLDQRHEIGPFRIFLGGSYSGVVRPEHADVVRLFGLGGIGANRALCRAGVMDVVPCAYSELPWLLTEGPLAADVVLAGAALPDETGRLGFGAACGYVAAPLATARTVVVEVNARAPRTRSRAGFSRADVVVEVDRPLVAQPAGAPDEIEARIAARVAELIPDGATVQLGVGKLPGAVLGALRGHRNLGLHTGIVGDEAIALIEAGVITNALKPELPGISVTGSLLGTEALYRFADGRRDLSMEPVEFTHAHKVLAALPRFTAINSALEVDLTGQVGAELVDGAFVGAVGGQGDFVRGALASEGGRSIIALPSRTRRGEPRIVAALASGTVTTPRADADLVVTEHGVAELRGQPIAERARRLIAIAHPDDREALERQALEGLAGIARPLGAAVR